MAFRIHIAGVDELNQHQFLTELRIERPLYEHSQAHIVLRWQEHVRYGDRATALLAAKILNCPIDVQWKDNDLAESMDCFHGYIEQVAARREASSSSLILDCVSFSKRTDLVPRYRTFQATTLLDICQQVAKSEPLIKIGQAGDLSLRHPLSVQHGETDFAYLSRMLHAWGIPMAVPDKTGQVILGARGAAAPGPFPDLDYGWSQIAFAGSAPGAARSWQAAAAARSESARGQVAPAQRPVDAPGRRLLRHPGPPSHSRDRHSKALSQVDTSGYRLTLKGAVLPFAPGEVVTFEGQHHLIHPVQVTGHPQQATATQEFWLQPFTLPLPPERRAPDWPSRALWAHVTANENDPPQQGRIQVEFEWEQLDPQASGERAWLHTLTPYGGGSRPAAARPPLQRLLLPARSRRARPGRVPGRLGLRGRGDRRHPRTPAGGHQ